jgi:hypothetical protein
VESRAKVCVSYGGGWGSMANRQRHLCGIGQRGPCGKERAQFRTFDEAVAAFSPGQLAVDPRESVSE